MRPFVHLHAHTEYSMLESTSRIPELVQKAVEFKMPALAITDHGNMFGAVRHYNTCTKHGIKPILGCEVYLTRGSRRDKAPRGKQNDGVKDTSHLVLLAKNATGYRNLCKLVSRGFTEGFYYRPRVDRELLTEYAEGLICTTGCMAGEVPMYLRAGRFDDALTSAKFFRDTFGPENFFVELENHGQTYEREVLPGLVEIAKRLGVETVASNDSHYTHHEDWEVHDVLLCIHSNNQRNDENRWRYPKGGQFYFKSGDEMYDCLSGFEGALENTLKIAEMVDFKLKEDYQLPLFDVPNGHTIDSYFAEAAREGFEMRRKTVLNRLKTRNLLRTDWPVYYDRLEQELEVVIQMGFPGYFLIVWDFIRKAKEMGVPVGPGRGSAAGSLVAYSLQITDIDPLQYDLLFERFLNKERVSMPDVDIDFCQYRRSEVIDYVTDKYGRSNVCQIVTYGTMKSRMVLKDVGRALNFTPSETNRIAKMVPEDLKITIPKALEQAPDFKELYTSDERARELIDISIKLEGLNRNTGVHAAGVIIAPGDVTDWAPIYKDPKKGTISLQYAKDEAEQIGLLKMDFLGLKTLTVISQTLDYIRETTGKTVNLDDITDFNDPETYKLFSKGETDGVFQFESDGMKNLLIRLGPKRFEDFIALNALYRPGPLGSGMVDTFIEGAHGAKVSYELPELEEILEETYGVILYQEQVMKIAQVVGGFSLAEADLLRRAMGKKKEEIMAQKKAEFLAGAKKNNFPEKACDGLFDKMAEFAKYGFNKSHSAAYALVAYQTAYLKANFKVQFMAALLTLDKDNTDKVVNYLDKCKQDQIAILPPDIRYSEDRFTVEKGAIRFALGAIKGIGDSALASIMETKQTVGIDSFYEFFQKVDLRKVNKKVIEVLVKSGAFDFTRHARRGMVEAAESLLKWGQDRQKEAAGGQSALFDGDDTVHCGVTIGEDEWPKRDLLTFEKETIGFYLSGHPLEEYRPLFRKHATCYSRDLAKMGTGTEIVMGGMIQAMRKITTAKGDMMAFLTVEDFYGMAEVVVFPRTFEKCKHMLEEDRMVVIKGKVEERKGNQNVLVQEIWDLSEWEAKRVRSCMIQFTAEDVSEAQLQVLYDHLTLHKGECQVYFEIQVAGKYRTVIKPRDLSIDPNRSLAAFTQSNPAFKMLLRY